MALPKHPQYVDGTNVLIGDRIQLVYKDPTMPSASGILKAIEHRGSQGWVFRFEHVEDDPQTTPSYHVGVWPKIQKVET